jgi:uncharacterized protein YbaR (Trm112 family)
MTRRHCLLGLFVLVLGCGRAPQPPAGAPESAANSAAVVPDGFDQGLLGVLRCPESLTAVRLATRKELDATNERIKTGKLKDWAGKTVTRPVGAMLIRADGKIAYRFADAIPVMVIEEALVLDEAVGEPHPDRHRK